MQQKGLTSAEINEAFRRVPEVTLPLTAAPAPSTAALATTTSLQPAVNVPTPMRQDNEPVRWSQVALGAGFVAAGAYAIKSLVWPFVRDKYSVWRSGGPEPDGTVPAPDANAVAEAIRAQTAELSSSIDAIQGLVAKLDAQRSPSPDDTLTATELRNELRSLAQTLTE